MNRFMLVGCAITVLLVTMSMYVLSVVLEPAGTPPPRLLLIGAGANEGWELIAAGARASARELGVDLRVSTLAGNNQRDHQLATCREIASANYDGVALCVAGRESQVDFINKIAGRTRLVTVGNDDSASNRLSAVGYSPNACGRRVVHMADEALRQTGNTLLLATSTSDFDTNAKLNERVAGFQEEWAERERAVPSTNRIRIVHISVDSTNRDRYSEDMRSALADPDLACIVAFDTRAAEFAIAALKRRPRTKHVRFIAFDPSKIVLDAIDNGLVDAAISEDPFRLGQESVQCLAKLCRKSWAEMPRPGRGGVNLFGEVVTKANVELFRKRTRLRQHPQSPESRTI